MSDVAESRRDEVREHQRRRIKALEQQVEGLQRYRQRLEVTAGLLALSLARGSESLSAHVLALCEELAAAALPAPQEPPRRARRADTVPPERWLEALRS